MLLSSILNSNVAASHFRRSVQGTATLAFTFLPVVQATHPLYHHQSIGIILICIYVTVCRLDSGIGVLLDAGEGTWGSLVRMCGYKAALHEVHNHC